MWYVPFLSILYYFFTKGVFWKCSQLSFFRSSQLERLRRGEGRERNGRGNVHKTFDNFFLTLANKDWGSNKAPKFVFNPEIIFLKHDFLNKKNECYMRSHLNSKSWGSTLGDFQSSGPLEGGKERGAKKRKSRGQREMGLIVKIILACYEFISTPFPTSPPCGYNSSTHPISLGREGEINSPCH